MNEWVIHDILRIIPSFRAQQYYPDLYDKMERLNRAKVKRTENPPFVVDDDLLPLLKALILRERLDVAVSVEQDKSKASSARALMQIEERLIQWDQIIRDKVFTDVEPYRLPHLMDVVTMEQFEDATHGKTKYMQRVFDEKFHAHLSPTLFHADLTFYRHKCGARDVPLVVVFLDIDKFKDFNTAVGETNVDRHVLRPFMAALEASVYGHGNVYRFGGDEYAIIFPSTDLELATIFLSRIQNKLANLKYEGVDKTTTVSVGFCTVYPDSYFTNEELLQRAERAKTFAKKKGRNCLATYLDIFLDEKDLSLVRPDDA